MANLEKALCFLTLLIALSMSLMLGIICATPPRPSLTSATNTLSGSLASSAEQSFPNLIPRVPATSFLGPAVQEDE